VFLPNHRFHHHHALLCFQDRGGGLKDKPGKSKDYYHTCYALSGMSAAQNNPPGFPPSIFNQNQKLVCHYLHYLLTISIC